MGMMMLIERRPNGCSPNGPVQFESMSSMHACKVVDLKARSASMLLLPRYLLLGEDTEQSATDEGSSQHFRCYTLP